MRFKNFYKTLTEAKLKGNQKERSVWFHGTSTTFLREILKKGLLANAPKKAYNADEDVGVTLFSMVTYGGVYLTKDFVKAHSSAINAVDKFGGNQLYIIAKIQPKTLVMDEDDITFSIPIERYSDENIIRLFKNLKYGIGSFDNMFYLKERNKFVNILYKNLLNKLNRPHSNLTKILYDFIVNEVWDSYVSRMFFYLAQSNNIRLQWEVYYRDIKFPELISKEDAENNFREKIDKLTKLLKGIIRNKKETAGRLLTDLKYSGNNKIIGIVEVKGKSVTVHYGKLHKEFLKHLIAYKGNLLTINGKQRRFLYPKDDGKI